ncbi:hypothetical protein, conserved [Thermococcus kodakarensis KOD1]|uniref:Quinolinate phosphoribosyl transferase N-terminal domain-containing protein n=1 Tax=Thermococcus kodakarensis (strain ATCC BAA-918 / JCM 12380 / KOD1) TaxID=69014 RepID=Q5JG77_THEKO|nr:hypothetical protein [Thermococcus kodakarensis]WCN28748.1 hypothetical protein POG15_03675 [Thermococcus kodakarensis]WCN31045.1 hypothetical protein POG21_03675 [Thermococcus kodakarensis]BAD84909.1 hypothetical protein, conserved [Thermococcus kodakarensis KOD1]
MEIVSRKEGIAAFTEGLSSFLFSLSLNVRFLPSGSEFKAGSTLLHAEGDLETLFKVWRVSQTFLSITCAIVTETRRLVERARKANPDVVIATTRKAYPEKFVEVREYHRALISRNSTRRLKNRVVLPKGVIKR